MKKVLKKKKKEELCNFSKKGKYEIAYLGCCPPSLLFLNIKGKLLFNPLKLAGIFNSTTKVSIFSIDLPKVSKSFNSGTFKKFGPKMPPTVIPANPSTMIPVRAIWEKKNRKCLN